MTQTAEHERFATLLHQVAQKIAAKTGAHVRFFDVEDTEHVQSLADWKKLLPADLRDASAPDILLSCDPRFLPPATLLPHTSRVTAGGKQAYPGQQADGVLVTPEIYENCYCRNTTRRFAVEGTILHRYPLRECLFDAERYAQACGEVTRSKKTITVLVASLHQVPHSDAVLAQIAATAKREGARVLVSGSKRTSDKDWRKITEAFSGLDIEFYRASAYDANVLGNPYYRFLAEGDRFIVLNSASMAADAAHTGKPVYANPQVLTEYEGLADYVAPLMPETNLAQPTGRKKLDIAGGITDAVLETYRHTQRETVAQGIGPYVRNLAKTRHMAARDGARPPLP